MVNKLENLCEERGIKVEFISHKFLDFDSEIAYNQPVIKVHKIFKQCPAKVATAVIEIFTGEGYTADCIEILEGFLVEKFGTVGIKLQPPQRITLKPTNKVENNNDSIDQYIEADISYIDATNMKGVQNKLENNEIIMPKEQDILELDIVLIPPIT